MADANLGGVAPRPYVNLIVYHGVLAPNAKWRRKVVDFGRPRLERPSSVTTPKKVGALCNRTWAELMRRGLDIDVLELQSSTDRRFRRWNQSNLRASFPCFRVSILE